MTEPQRQMRRSDRETQPAAQQTWPRRSLQGTGPYEVLLHLRSGSDVFVTIDAPRPVCIDLLASAASLDCSVSPGGVPHQVYSTRRRYYYDGTWDLGTERQLETYAEGTRLGTSKSLEPLPAQLMFTITAEQEAALEAGRLTHRELFRELLGPPVDPGML